jgi:hypothetical protein
VVTVFASDPDGTIASVEFYEGTTLLSGPAGSLFQ